MSQYFPKPFRSFGGNINVKDDLSNYATKTDLKNVTHVDVYDQLVAKVNNIDASDFVLKTNYKTDKTELEKKIPDVTYFVKKVKFTELENSRCK